MNKMNYNPSAQKEEEGEGQGGQKNQNHFIHKSILNPK